MASFDKAPIGGRGGQDVGGSPTSVDAARNGTSNGPNVKELGMGGVKSSGKPQGGK